MSTLLKALIVEDSEDDTVALLRQLRHGGYDPTYEQVDSPQAMQAALDRETWDIIISDYNMPSFSAPAALKLLQETGNDIPFIILSGVIGEDDAVASMKAGAHDYIMKGNVARLIPAVDRELREAQQRQERKQLEAQFLQAQKMESIGRLAGGVAHDFNNLLTSIMGHAQLGAMKLPEGHRLHEHLEEIQRASESASNLTKQLLAFSRRQVIEPKVVNLNDLLGNISKMLERLIGEDIELITLTKPDLGLVTVDPGQFEQVIMNLVINARDAIPQGGKIVIEAVNAILDSNQARQAGDITPGKYAMVLVTDDGTGMPDEVKEHIFEPFFTTKEEGKGTGLGLATCYGIINQSGGHIEVESRPGIGTTFTLYLPQVDSEPTTPVADPSEEQARQLPKGNETVLLAEDEPVVRSVLASMLNDQGYNVLQAANGDEALSLAQRHRQDDIHLLLADIVMPQMNGIDLANQFLTIHPYTRILFTSGYPDEPVLRQGSVDFIQKPFVPAALSRKVREVLDKPVSLLNLPTGG